MFRAINILGAGELGATLARRLAERELARRIVLVDPEDARARGKALDIAQSGPVERFDVRVEAVARLDAAGPAEVVVVADPPALDDASLSPARSAELAAGLVPSVGGAALVLAGVHAPALVEAAVRQGLPRERVMGSAPVAFAAALRRRVGDELQVEPREVAALVMGLPPGLPVVPEGSIVVAGVPAARLSAAARRRDAAGLRPPGPVALAAAALRVIQALAGSRASVVPVFAVLAGEYGHRGVALAVPARLAAGRIESIVEVDLQPVERVAFDNAAERARQRT